MEFVFIVNYKNELQKKISFWTDFALKIFFFTKILTIIFKNPCFFPQNDLIYIFKVLLI